MASKYTVRTFEDKDQVEKYDSIQPNYAHAIVDKIMEFAVKFDLEKSENDKYFRMLDVGCGSGRSTHLYSDYFESILGFDISESQIELANKLNENDNVSYQVVQGNCFPAEDGTIDFVACAGTLHLLDIELFEKECNRVLKPNGCVVAYTYFLSWMEVIPNNQEKDPVRIQEKDLCKILAEYMEDCLSHPRHKILFTKYKDIYDRIKNKDKTWTKDLWLSKKFSSLAVYKDFATSNGYYQTYKQMKLDDFKSDPAEIFFEKLQDYFGEVWSNEAQVKVHFEVFMVSFGQKRT